MEPAEPVTGKPQGGDPPGSRADDDMDLAPSGPEPSQEALNAAAEEACKEAEEAEQLQKAQEAMDAKAAKAQIILARMKAKTQPVWGKCASASPSTCCWTTCQRRERPLPG